MAKKFEKLKFGGLHEKHAVQFQELFVLYSAQTASETHQPHLQGVEQSGCETDHSPPSSAEVK
jgi:hypothetical protein